MQISSVSIFTNSIKKCASVVKGVFSRNASLSDMGSSGMEALAAQNRVIVKPANQIESERVDFTSTKEMFNYAKGKIIPPLMQEKPCEYTVVANVKENKVIAEYIGEQNTCSLKNLEALPLDDENVVLLHGHPDSYPISKSDLKTLLDYKVNQVIAIDKNGKFSMVARRHDTPCASSKSNAYKKFCNDDMSNTDYYYDCHNKDFYKIMVHDTLRTNAENLGIRYITNYGYLIKNDKYLRG